MTTQKKEEQNLRIILSNVIPPDMNLFLIELLGIQQLSRDLGRAIEVLLGFAVELEFVDFNIFVAEALVI